MSTARFTRTLCDFTQRVALRSHFAATKKGPVFCRAGTSRASHHPAIIKHVHTDPSGELSAQPVNPFTSAGAPASAGNQPCQPHADGERDHKSQ